MIRMDPDNPVIKLCIEGAQAEFAGSVEEADKLYRQAWTAARDDYERCVAAHYVARCQKTPEERLHWNREALVRAEAVGDEQVRSFYRRST